MTTPIISLKIIVILSLKIIRGYAIQNILIIDE